ncbi:MAG: dUTP diphosphatase [Paracoccaceae bacterium]
MSVLRIARAAWADASMPLPAYETAGAAGMDLRADLRGGTMDLPPLGRALVPTGLHMEIAQGHEVQIRPRSGLALKLGLTILNAPGTIDSDYRGEVGVIMVNLSDTPVTIAHGARIAQAVLAAVTRAEIVKTDSLGPTARGAGGFGSTGV